jgi:hypothetical protein
MQKLWAIPLFVFVLGSSVFAAATNDVEVTIAANPWIDASFSRKVKTKKDGWMIYLRLTNKTNKPIYNLSTSFDLREDNWKIESSNYSVSSSTAILKPKESRVLDWMRNVPTSVNHIHIVTVEPDFQNYFQKPFSRSGSP